MRPARKTASLCLILCLTALSARAQQASKFLRLCHSSMAKAEALFAECKQKARPFTRIWLPGGHGPGEPEHHAAWFDTANAGSHFGFGCVLGPKDQVRFFGLYFFLKQTNFSAANTAPFNFIDFQGNTGLRSAEGTSFTLLAAHRLTPPVRARNVRDSNCEIGDFDATANTTIKKTGPIFGIHKVDFSDPPLISFCSNREAKYDPNQCVRTRLRHRSFLNETISPVIYNDLPQIIITEQARLFVEEGIFNKICGSEFRSALEPVNFIKEVCSLNPR
jgi:hypothetical protein